jgi:hypothetical protein
MFLANINVMILIYAKYVIISPSLCCRKSGRPGLDAYKSIEYKNRKL